ncbi:MAG: class I SAM-dependent methyltransferase [Sphaerochaetaceae bacterium]|nr:class I SAM-dependent methyltransferase [Sphaerochaetaceae bacterium]
MDSTKRFSSRADLYSKYRPSYPKSAVNFLFSNGINKNSIVGDVGSGTGILSSLLIDKVKRLYCVEPNDEMRNYANKSLSDFDNFISINAKSESTTLDDNSLDAITVAQAFHWFDIEKTKIEFNRVLKPNSNIFLLWNNRISNTPFLREYDQILKSLSIDYKSVNHQNLGRVEFDFFFDKKWCKTSFSNFQKLDFESFIGRVFSSSYTPEEGNKNYNEFYNELKKLFDRENQNGFINFNYNTEIISKRL